MDRGQGSEANLSAGDAVVVPLSFPISRPGVKQATAIIRNGHAKLSEL